MSTYRQILKSTSIIGGSSFINMAIGMVRTKFVAVLLGPTGMGLMGIYQSITGMVGTATAMGIGTSGVRQVAEAYGAGDADRLAHTVKSLRRFVWATGILGMMITMLGCVFISRISFGSSDHAFVIALLGITILLGHITDGQSCILQGTRRIGDLARVSIIGALNGTIISIPCYFFWGMEGIAPSLILIAVATLVTTWWYARRVQIKSVTMPWRESREDVTDLLRFGIPFMLAMLLTTLTGYLIRIFLVRHFGLDGVGIWQAAFMLSSVLVNFVLRAMGTDYYPRLTAVAHDNQLVNESVNTQTEIALLLAVPGLAATIIFAPLAIKIFYSGRFDASVDILRWSVYGIFGRVVSWPLGYIMLAKGMGKTFFFSESFANLFYLSAVWGCTKIWGLPGTGIAFMLLYTVYTSVVYAIGYAVVDFTWNRSNYVHIAIFSLLLVAVGLISALITNPWYQYAINIVSLFAITIYCFRRLMRKSGGEMRMFLAKVGIKGSQKP